MDRHLIQLGVGEFLEFHQFNMNYFWFYLYLLWLNKRLFTNITGSHKLDRNCEHKSIQKFTVKT